MICGRSEHPLRVCKTRMCNFNAAFTAGLGRQECRSGALYVSGLPSIIGQSLFPHVDQSLKRVRRLYLAGHLTANCRYRSWLHQRVAAVRQPPPMFGSQGRQLCRVSMPLCAVQANLRCHSAPQVLGGGRQAGARRISVIKAAGAAMLVSAVVRQPQA